MDRSVRIERDSLGEIEVPQDAYYGPQTMRALHHFPIGRDRMPSSLIHAYGLIKKMAAEVNAELGLLPKEKAKFIVAASEEVREGKWDQHFPLSVWQSGSGTQSHMNVNEVIAKRASELSGNLKIHPNDDVNLSQSTNDTFPTAMHIATLIEIRDRLKPSLEKLRNALTNKSEEFYSIVKVGRTHLMDAVPIRLGQEFSGYAAQIEQNIERIEKAMQGLHELALGATAVGTGLLSPKEFAPCVIGRIAKFTKLPFVQAKNLFAAIAAHDALLFLGGALSTLSASLTKIASDLGWMGSGPRSGLSELKLPENEPGSSIMPGKINPTQVEMILMVSIQVQASMQAIEMAGSRGNFELNVYKPLIIYNLMHAIELLSDGMHAFTEFFVVKLKPNIDQIKYLLDRSLMLVTPLRERLGYDKAAEVALKAYHENISLKEAAMKLGYLREADYDSIVIPENMV